MSLGPDYEAMFDLAFPESPLGVAEPPVDPLLTRGEAGRQGQVTEGTKTPPPTLSGPVPD